MAHHLIHYNHVIVSWFLQSFVTRWELITNHITRQYSSVNDFAEVIAAYHTGIFNVTMLGGLSRTLNEVPLISLYQIFIQLFCSNEQIIVDLIDDCWSVTLCCLLTVMFNFRIVLQLKLTFSCRRFCPSSPGWFSNCRLLVLL